MTLPASTDSGQPIRKSAQRLRWFVQAFEEQAEQTSRETGTRYTVDHGRLAAVFAQWLKDFQAQKPERDEDKPAYVGFAAGLMLRTLIEMKPVSVAALPGGADTTNPAYFWPEGYLYVVFCLNVRGLVLEGDYHGEQHTSALLNETRTWWSFKENVADDPSLAMAFLDLFAGDEPQWSVPHLFRTGRIRGLADRFYKQETLKAVD
ncbi:MAG: hypothetical protein ED558_08565 [Oricola sp.]|nr:MAG: hypothetical protein ED558_08565 [Oricola sp.]